MSKIKVLYLPGGAHLYGDNRSLLGTLSLLKDKINILVGITEYGPMCDELDRLGISYFMVYSSMAPKVTFNYKHYTLSERIKNKLGYWYFSVKAFIKLEQIIRTFQPDIIHTNNSTIYSGAKIAKRHGIEHVWHIREYIDLDHDAKFPDKKFYDKNREWSHCIAITKGIFNHFNFRVGKDTQIYNGVCSVNDIKEYQREKQDYFLYLGRLVHTKGCEDMIKAFAEFAKTHSQYKLLIAGDGEENYVRRLKSLASELDAGDKIKFLGFQKNIDEYLSSARALIVPSFFEAMGRITAEAMLAGCFVIGRGTAGTKELLDNENTGILFNNVEELTMAMTRVAEMSITELEEKNRHALASATKSYTTEVNANKVLAFYNSIMGQ